jgi:hypothetical protein
MHDKERRTYTLRVVPSKKIETLEVTEDRWLGEEDHTAGWDRVAAYEQRDDEDEADSSE